MTLLVLPLTLLTIPLYLPSNTKASLAILWGDQALKIQLGHPNYGCFIVLTHEKI
jgi:hypothetical protein